MKHEWICKEIAQKKNEPEATYGAILALLYLGVTYIKVQ